MPDGIPPGALGEEEDPFAALSSFEHGASSQSVPSGRALPGPAPRNGGDRHRPADNGWRGAHDGGRSSGHSGGRNSNQGGGQGGYHRSGHGGFGSSGIPELASRLAAARMPPHSIEAEQALLGALMVTTEGFDKISDVVTESDFYQDNHRLIFRAIGSLVAESKNPDVVTVAGWLDANGVLQDANGLDYVAAMVEVAPSAANLKAYGEIVRERSVLRQMITVANEIADSAFVSEGRTSKELLDEAETKVFAIADQTSRSGTGFKDIRTILSGALDRISELFEKGGAITGLETGFTELDEMTSGLQQSDLVIIAGRPAMGKTTFAMNIAEHAAMTADKPVAVFSMEMPAEQLAMRLIASLGRVELSKIRNGNLSEQDWPRITSAITMLNEKRSVYIDDTPALTPTDLRARSRRLARDRGLSLIVIDYLQLMKVANSKENRATEISEISGSLKALAKELHVPIIALSQLNRSLEQRPNKRPVMSDLRECVTGDTRVALADGRQVPIVSLVGSTPRVLSITAEGTIEPADSDCVWLVGDRPVFKVSLASGRTIRCTEQHRLMGFDDWQCVSDLSVGDRLALPRVLPEPAASKDETDARIVLLAHLVGDGSYVSGQPLRYTTASEASSRIVRDAAESMGSTVNRREGTGNWHQLEIAGNGNRWHPAGVGLWLKQLGVFGQRSRQKRLPEFVFELATDRLALFMRHLWVTDGCIYTPNDRQPRIYFATSSRGLAEDVATLLLRFEIVARIRRVIPANSDGWYTVDVSGAEGMSRYVERIGGFGEQEAGISRLRRILKGRKANTNIDTLPVAVFNRVKDRMRDGGISQRAMAASRGTSYGGSAHFAFAPSRQTLAGYAELLDDPELHRIATSDLFWDRIVAIEPDGTEPVYDLTVPGNASWIGNDIVSHNSGAIEQDADIIMFIYRDEVYHPEDESNHGRAEVIIGKQRNGPIGTANLTFLGKFTRFENYSPEVQGGDF